MARTPSPASSPRSRGRMRSRSPLSRSRSRTPSGSRSRSRTRTPSGSRSRSRSPSPTGSDQDKNANANTAAWDEKIDYEDFVAADEETPTFKLDEATLKLVTSKVYKAAPLAKKYFLDMKKERYMLPREIHETLEPKPVPAQVALSSNGWDFNKLHGGLLTLHNVSRIAQRPIWALMELLQITRGNLKNMGVTFVSPPFLVGPTTQLPDGHVNLDYSEEEQLRHMAKLPQNPTQQQIEEMHRSLGVYKRFYEVSSTAMTSMLSTIQLQQETVGKVRESLDVMWGRTQDYINMARYLETHIKDMRRDQLVKAHTKEFTEFLDNVHLKDRKELGARDLSDEILAADYDGVLKQFNEWKKNKNTALKSYSRRPSSSGSSQQKNSSSGYNRGSHSGRRDDPPPPPPPRRDGRDGREGQQDGGKRSNRNRYSKKNNKGKDPAPSTKKKQDKDKAA